MDTISYVISAKIEGLEEATAKIEKINALMEEIKALAKSLEESICTIKIPDED